MATNKTITDTIGKLDPRLTLGLQAIWQLDALLDAMLDRVPPDHQDLALRAMCIRAQQLSGAVMDAFDESGTEISQLFYTVHAQQPLEANHV
jgi:hypothetical protein